MTGEYNRIQHIHRDVMETKYGVQELRRELQYLDKKLNALMFGPQQAYMDELLKKEEEKNEQRKAG
jgi:hypothetical protein